MAPRPNLKDLKTISLATLTQPAQFFGRRPPQAGDVCVLDDAGTGLLMWVIPTGPGWTKAYYLMCMNAHGKDVLRLTP